MVEVKLSRHAKRRIKLYNIPEDKVIRIISEAQIGRGKQSLVKEVEGYSYPLKIIFEVSDNQIVMISCYPLKRGV